MTVKNKEIKVAQVLAGAENGGAENFYTRLVVALQESGNIEQIGFLRNYQHRVETLNSGGVQTHCFRFGSILNVLDRFQYQKQLKSVAPDIVMTWMNRASKLTSKGNYHLVSRLGHYYDLKYYRHADYWVGITKGICDHLVKGGMPASRIVQIPNFADETVVEPLARDSFNTPLGVPLILAAGRLHVNKGFDILLKALKGIPEVILWLAGEGPEEAKLKILCEDLGITHRVRFLGWRKDVTALMRSVDLFVCPSRHEGLGSIVVESWAHDCPIIATNSQGPGELIEDGVTGILTPVDEVDALQHAIINLVNNNGDKERIVRNAKHHYLQQYSRETIVSQYERFYREIVS